MIITKTAKWEVAEYMRGVRILKRIKQTGTAGGRYLAASTLFDTLKDAREYVMSIPDSSLIVYQDHSRAANLSQPNKPKAK